MIGINPTVPAQTRNDADHLEYLPLDTAPSMRKMVEWLRPRAVVFLKFDCWPNLIWAAREAEVPVLLLDGTLHRHSYRLRPVARQFFGRIFSCLGGIGAISDDDARRFHLGLGRTRQPEGFQLWRCGHRCRWREIRPTR